MKRNETNVTLYNVTLTDGKLNATKIHEAKIIGKNLYICTLLDNFDSKNQNQYFFNDYSFSYSYNLPFDFYIETPGKKKQRLNTQIKYYSIGNKEENKITLYTHFNCYQRILNSYNFKNLWIQQSINIMWIINILIALIIGFSSFLKCCD